MEEGGPRAMELTVAVPFTTSHSPPLSMVEGEMVYLAGGRGFGSGWVCGCVGARAEVGEKRAR